MIINVNKLGYTPIPYTPIIDIDGNMYDTVRINNQEWVTTNLKATKYSDGTSIQNLSLTADWINDVSGGYCEYDNSAGIYKNDYGYLYNWYAVSNSKGLAYFTKNGIVQNGWRVASMTDVSTLSTFFGGNSVSGKKLKESGNAHWTAFSGIQNTNESKLTILPGGERKIAPLADFNGINTYGYLWTSTEYDPTDAYYYFFDYNTNTTRNFPPNFNKNYGMSIRCVRDL